MAHLVVFVDLVLDDEHVPGLLQFLDGLCVRGLQLPHRAVCVATHLILHLLQEAQLPVLLGLSHLQWGRPGLDYSKRPSLPSSIKQILSNALNKTLWVSLKYFYDIQDNRYGQR